MLQRVSSELSKSVSLAHPWDFITMPWTWSNASFPPRDLTTFASNTDALVASPELDVLVCSALLALTRANERKSWSFILLSRISRYMNRCVKNLFRAIAVDYISPTWPKTYIASSKLSKGHHQGVTSAQRLAAVKRRTAYACT